MKRVECACDECKRACSHRPGWFRPGEAEKAAKAMGLSLQQFFDTYLVADYWCGDSTLPETFLLAPATRSAATGIEAPCNPKGRCVFLTKYERCAIHATKPAECAEWKHGQSKAEVTARRLGIVKAWGKRQKQVEKLLGRRPEVPEPDLCDMFDMLFG